MGKTGRKHKAWTFFDVKEGKITWKKKEKKYDGKKILITGINGFIGVNLAKALYSSGAIVEGTTRNPEKIDYLKASGDEEKYTLHTLDIKDFEGVSKLLKEGNYDYLFHLASQSDTWKSISNPFETIQTNLMGTLNILETIRKNNSPIKIILAGTVRVFYDDRPKSNLAESNEIVHHPYDASKMSMETIASSYFKAYHITGAIAKNTNTYGENDLNFSRLIPLIMKQTVLDKRIKLKGNGLVKRDFMYIEDAIDGLLKLGKELGNEEVNGETFTFATEQLFSIKGLCNQMKQIVDFPLPVEFDESSAFTDRDQSNLSTYFSEKILGWKAKTTLSEGLKKTYNWYYSYLSGGNPK